MSDLTNEILQALIRATDEQKEQALRVLRGEPLNPTPEIAPYLQLTEVAEKLNLHPGTLCKWRVPKHDLAGRPRYLLAEVRAYLESPEFKLLAADLRAARHDNKRKEQLLALAAEGNAAAAADLFKEFNIEVKAGGKGGAS